MKVNYYVKCMYTICWKLKEIVLVGCVRKGSANCGCWLYFISRYSFFSQLGSMRPSISLQSDHLPHSSFLPSLPQIPGRPPQVTAHMANHPARSGRTSQPRLRTPSNRRSLQPASHRPYSPFQHDTYQQRPSTCTRRILRPSKPLRRHDHRPTEASFSLALQSLPEVHSVMSCPFRHPT